jgi:hypothetical protein
MKKMKKIIIIGLALLTVLSCEDLTELNEDIKNPKEVPAGALFASATKDLFDFMTEPNVNVNNFRLWAQQWAQTTYADESNYELVERNVNGAAWNRLYAEVIRDLDDAKKIIQADELLSDEAKTTQVAMAEVLQVFAYHVLVDIFGDIPYNEALTDDVTPAYDDDAAIYNDLVSRLNAAIPNLSGGSQLSNYDLVYGGNVEMWKLLANSLKLRLAIRMAQVNNSMAQTMAEEAVASGVFTSNDDNFLLKYQSSTPNTNPLWVSLIQSGRSDYVVASTLIDIMNELGDPRLLTYASDPVAFGYPVNNAGVEQDSTFFTEGLLMIYTDMSGEDSTAFLSGEVTIFAADTLKQPRLILGGAYGDNNAFNTFSHPGVLQEDPTFPGIIMSYWEVAFLLADAAERGYNVGGTAEEFYNAGIEASVLYWVGDEAAVADYLDNPDVAYATAPGTPFQRIALQKWISLYDQGFEAWSTVRLYDYPKLPIAVLSELPTPTRYTYPVTEYSLNEENVETAGTAMGGDALDTNVFWDVAQ